MPPEDSTITPDTTSTDEVPHGSAAIAAGLAALTEDPRSEGGAPAEISGAPATPDPYQLLATLPRDEVINRHPHVRDTFAGMQGRVKQLQTEIADLRANVRSDPYATAEKLDEEEAQAPARETEARLKAYDEALTTYDEAFSALLQKLPTDMAGEIAREFRDTETVADRIRYLGRVFEAYGEVQAAGAAGADHRVRAEALETELRMEQARHQPRPNTAGSVPVIADDVEQLSPMQKITAALQGSRLISRRT